MVVKGGEPLQRFKLTPSQEADRRGLKPAQIEDMLAGEAAAA